MKKLTRKLLVSIIAVAFAFAALGTSTYAWFSMNTTVTVTGMQLTAKSDNTYLLIGTGDNDTAAEIQAISPASTNINFEMGETKVLPCAPKTAGIIGNEEGKLFATGTPVTDKTTAETAANWYTAEAATSAAPTMKSGSAVSLESLTGYVIQKTVYLTVAVGAQPANNLKVNATITQKSTGNDVAAYKAVIVTDDGGFAIVSTENNNNVSLANGSNTDITSSTVRRVDIFLYVDGDNAAIYTNNAINLTGVTIGLSFNVASHPAA